MVRASVDSGRNQYQPGRLINRPIHGGTSRGPSHVHHPAIAGIENEKKFCGGKFRLQGEPAFRQKPIVSSEIQRDALAAVQWSFIQRWMSA